jgi:hypothetical protein
MSVGGGEVMSEPVAKMRFRGDVRVRPFRRGTYLGHEHLETLIERALGDRYRFGEGWSGFGIVSITLYEQPPASDGDQGAEDSDDQGQSRRRGSHGQGA